MIHTTTTGHCPECARNGFESESMKDHPQDVEQVKRETCNNLDYLRKHVEGG